MLSPWASRSGGVARADRATLLWRMPLKVASSSGPEAHGGVSYSVWLQGHKKAPQFRRNPPFGSSISGVRVSASAALQIHEDQRPEHAQLEGQLAHLTP